MRSLFSGSYLGGGGKFFMLAAVSLALSLVIGLNGTQIAMANAVNAFPSSFPIEVSAARYGATAYQADSMSPICENSWKDPIDGTWTEAAKWSSGAVPTSADDVCIIVDGTFVVTLNGPAYVNSLVLGAPGSTGIQTLNVMGNPWVGAGNLVAANGLVNRGTINLSDIGNGMPSALTVNGGVLTNKLRHLQPQWRHDRWCWRLHLERGQL